MFRSEGFIDRAGLYLAIAAIAVNAPRLILAFLEADGITVAPPWRTALLGLTGIASGVVLTGGGAFLAHALARGSRRQGLLATTWLLVLTCATVLVTPLLVAGLARQSLAVVLPTAHLRWLWSAVAVVAIELVAAGAMAAHELLRSDERLRQQAEEQLLAVAAERNHLRRLLERLREQNAALRPAQAQPVAGASARRSPSAAAPAARRPSSAGLRSAGSADSAPAAYPCPWGCGFAGPSQNSRNAHMRHCTRRPRR